MTDYYNMYILDLLFRLSNQGISVVSACDAAEPLQLNLQDPATPAVEGMLFFHNFLCSFLLLIGALVMWMLYVVIKSFDERVSSLQAQKFTHSAVLEIVWTILPAVALLFIAIPSFGLLYALDEIVGAPALTLKVIGSQWFWTYEYSDVTNDLLNEEPINYDSYMVATEDLEFGSFRLLEVDNKVRLPINTQIRVLVTATDVLHSWAVPSFGIKVDACPGRLSQSFLFLKREGLYFGQCSEICGVNHGFMPIAVHGISKEAFFEWISRKKLEL